MPGPFAEFTLSGNTEILRCAQDDSEGLRVTAHRLVRFFRQHGRKAPVGTPALQPANNSERQGGVSGLND